MDAFRQITQLMIFCAAIFLPYLSFSSPEDVRRWILFTNIGCLANAIVGLVESVQWVAANGFVFLANGKFFRFMGLCASPMDYTMMLMAGLYMASLVTAPRTRLSLVAFYCAMLLLSMSRSGLVVLFIALLIYLFSGLREGRRVKTFFAGVCAFLAVLAVSGALDLVLERVRDIGNINYNIKRFVTYQDVLSKIFADAGTLLFGNGFGTYRFFHPVDFQWYDNPHNIFLHILYTTGLGGFLIFSAAMAFLIARTATLRGNLSASRDLQPVVKTILLVHVCTWLVGMVETNITGVSSAWLFGSLFGIPLVFVKLERKPCIS